ncbi:hypothetical protein KFE25_000363 [Diacronema lutheri]|uniref:Uncharacterized protein n=2 Tax=Diacronema lutheri TaxID=2081491 RepID=A0A8J6C9Z2_DIALT|nr:hypothetical protein KFE25_000363 [Diacronema lutheri]
MLSLTICSLGFHGVRSSAPMGKSVIRMEGQNSKALPFAPRPALLDGTLAGDNGFDPLGLAESESRLAFYREAEIRHCRLAMLAAANWPLAELLNKPLAKLLNLPAITEQTGGLAPSIPNGGLGQVSAAFWLLVVAIGILAEVGEITPLLPEARIAGDLGFDPLGLFAKMTAQEKRTMQDKELANGRLAMIAITVFVVQEFVSKKPTF